jgi:hypothetical protein
VSSKFSCVAVSAWNGHGSSSGLDAGLAMTAPLGPYDPPIANYVLNERAVARARERIEARQYVLDSEWGAVQPDAGAENEYLRSHSWDEYADWHLGLREGARDETKARYGFVYGDFRRVHRSALIASVYRAASWRHKQVELAAFDLLQLLDKVSGEAG